MIICECGHGMNEHYCDGAGCMYVMSGCGCELTPGIIEARYWARRMMAERECVAANGRDLWM